MIERNVDIAIVPTAGSGDSRTFIAALSLVAMLAPIATVIGAFAASAEAPVRAALVVAGMEATVLGLLGALAVRAALGFSRRAADRRGTAPARARGALLGSA